MQLSIKKCCERPQPTSLIYPQDHAVGVEWPLVGTRWHPVVIQEHIVPPTILAFTSALAHHTEGGLFLRVEEFYSKYDSCARLFGGAADNGFANTVRDILSLRRCYRGSL